MSELVEWTIAVLSIPFLALAVYRLWRIIAVDQITEPIRNLFIWNNTPLWNWITDLVTCPWCLGFHLSIVMWALWTFLPQVGYPVVTILAMSTLVGLIGKLDGD